MTDALLEIESKVTACHECGKTLVYTYVEKGQTVMEHCMGGLCE